MSTKLQRVEIHDVLVKLHSDGRLTPDAVIDEARNPNSPLHSQFTWDVDAAALQTWRQQARQLISSFRVEVVTNHKKFNVKEFWEDPTKPEKEQGYVSLFALRSKSAEARQVYERALSLATAHLQNATEFAEALGVRHRVDSVIEEIGNLRAVHSEAAA